MSRINRPPLGLQALLGSKNFGVNPDDLEQTVQPTLDMLPFFGVSIMENKHASGARTTPGTIASLEVGPGVDDEIWMLLGVSMYLPSITGVGPHTLQGAIALNRLAGDQTLHNIAVSPVETVPTTEVWGMGFMLPVPIILEQGAIIQYHWLQNNLPNLNTVDCNALVYKLPA